MNELRWILLVAGVILIAGVYLWGTRSRVRARSDAEASRRPAVFSGTATGFESPPAQADSGSEPEFISRPATSDDRRIEPSVSLDTGLVSSYETGQRIDFEDEPVVASAAGRREPTLGTHAEPTLAQKLEPNLRSRTPPPVARPESAPARAAAPAVEDAAPAAAAQPKRASQRIFAVRVSATPPARLDGARLLEALQSEGLNFGRYDIFHRMHEDGRPVFSVASLREPGTFELQAMAGTSYPGIALFTVLPGPVEASEAFDEMIFTARALATHLDGSLLDERGTPLTALRVGKLREEAIEFERSAGLA